MSHFRAYLSLARPDNWTKNLLVLGGAALAVAVLQPPALNLFPLALALGAACLASSANYTLNEWVDAARDRFHPIKKKRAAVRHRLRASIVAAQYFALAVSALLLAAPAGHGMLATLGLFLAAAWAYNLPPLALKQRPYVDALAEALNYPLRILMGWLAIAPETLPPSSLLLTAWSAGGFAMTVKRLAEFRLFASPEEAVRYRRAYRVCTPPRLLPVALVYAMLCAFGLAVFLLKYRIEFVLAFPLIAAWFAWYLSLGLQGCEEAVYPERLLRRRRLLIFSLLVLLALITLSQTRLPWLDSLNEPHLIPLPL